ncbi:hypothetical protein D9615_006682 [Tricholomella constricta]|uniref:Reverse transcriptase n=1 Tax=Tricholomella constricta TaxID=117010 RepID=A0A8H5H6X9_9AGAR|nr:hypothetical protein D9615_006682 [Tricholomella constricta]
MVVRSPISAISGDWNQHHPDWSIGNRPPSTKTRQLVDWIRESGYTLLNDKGIPTYFEHRSRGATSVIDLTFANPSALALDTTKEWTIDDSLACGSDHHALRWVIDHGSTEIENITGTKYNFKDADPVEWKNAFDAEIEKEKVRWETLTDLDTPRSPEELDRDVELITEALKAATASTVKEKKHSKKAKPWWSDALDDANNERTNLRQQQRTHKERWGTYCEVIHSSLKKTTNYFRRLFKHERRTWVNKTLEDATPDEIWGLRNWSKGSRNYPSPAINRPNQMPAVQHEDKCDALRNTLFKPPPQLNNNPPPNLQHTQDHDKPHFPLTKTEVREAIYRHSAKKAPGESQQTFATVRWAWETQENIIFALMHHCTQTGHHPKTWRRAIAVALRKPNKPDYSEPRAYRLIQLLECLGKVLEGIIARRLAYMVGREDLVPPNQFGGRPNSSTNDALLTHVEDIQAAHNHKKVTSVLTFDISGYFDNVNHDRLLRELRRKGIPLPLVKWVAAFLRDREASICLDGLRGDMKPVANGIPQGSPVSPILSIIYTAELQELMELKKTPAPRPGGPRPPRIPDDPTNTNLDMYIDDGNIRISSYSLDTNVIMLRSSFITVNDWLTNVGLSTAAEKTELMHHSWRRDKGHSPNIKLPTANGTEVSIAAGDTIRILGVFFDRRLTFNQHVRILADRAGNTVRGSRMLANTMKGLSQVELRTLYQACVVPVLTYGSPVWWTGKKTHINILDKVQNTALRHIAGAFKTTPIKALEIDLAIPPINLALDLANARYADRLHKLNHTNPVLQRLSSEWRDGTPPISPPPLPSQKPTKSKKPPKRTQLEKIAASTYRPSEGEKIIPFISPPWRRTARDFGPRLTISGADPKIKKDDAAKTHNRRTRVLLTDPSNLLIYSDGSMLDAPGDQQKKNVGWGVVGYHKDKEVIARRGGLGHTAEVYDAELTGLVVAAKEATTYAQRHPRITNLHIYADNTAAVTSSFEPKTQPGQYNISAFNKTITDFLDRNQNHSVHVEWCPGHTDVKGNERADEEAKEGAILWQPRFVTLTHAMRSSKAQVLKKWNEEWKRTPPTGGFGIANQFPPAWKIKQHVKTTPREVFSRLTQCRTRHAFIGEYYSKFVPTEPTECPCGEAIQTREHIITTCPIYDDHRHILTEDYPELDLKDILGTKNGIEALAKFIKQSGAFTKTGAPRHDSAQPTIDDAENVDEGEGNWWDRWDRPGRGNPTESGEEEEERESEDEEDEE